MHKAKEYLLKYRTAKKRADRINEQIEELRTRYALPSAINYSDMPKAHSSEHDLSDYIVKLEKLTNGLLHEYNKCMGIEEDIRQRLSMMENDDERELLRLRYISGLKWEEIIEKIPYSDRHVYRMHGDALNHFPL